MGCPGCNTWLTIHTGFHVALVKLYRVGIHEEVAPDMTTRIHQYPNTLYPIPNPLPNGSDRNCRARNLTPEKACASFEYSIDSSSKNGTHANAYEQIASCTCCYRVVLVAYILVYHELQIFANLIQSAKIAQDISFLPMIHVYSRRIRSSKLCYLSTRQRASTGTPWWHPRGGTPFWT